MSIARTLRRKQHAVQPESTILDSNNAVWADQHKTLHPTKGWRKISVKRTLIAGITQRIKTGQHGFDQAMIRRILNREVFI